MKQFFLAFMVLCLVGLNIWAFIQTSSASPHSTLINQPNRKQKVSNHKEKFIVVELGSPDSPIFLKHHSNGHTERVYRKYGSNGVVFVSINSPEDDLENGYSSEESSN